MRGWGGVGLVGWMVLRDVWVWMFERRRWLERCRYGRRRGFWTDGWVEEVELRWSGRIECFLGGLHVVEKCIGRLDWAWVACWLGSWKTKGVLSQLHVMAMIRT